MMTADNFIQELGNKEQSALLCSYFMSFLLITYSVTATVEVASKLFSKSCIHQRSVFCVALQLLLTLELVSVEETE